MGHARRRPSPEVVADVVWSRRAIADLETIREYISQFNPLAAQRVAQRLYAAGKSLSDFPERGRPIGKRRELVIVRPYIIRYRVFQSRVEILAIRHGAQEPD
jgi:addiction module RelE/StbE family toxin